MKLAIVTSHPIQYQAPWFQALASSPGVKLRVFFKYIPDPESQGRDFDIPFTWDIPLLRGYDWENLNRPVSSPFPSRSGIGDAAALFKALKSFSPDAAVICGWGSFYMLAAMGICRLLRIPCLLRGESNCLPRRPAFKKLLHRIIFIPPAGFLAIGTANRRLYLDRGVRPERIFLTGYFVDNERFQRQMEKERPRREALRRDWGISPDAFCFLFAGKLVPKKRIGDLLEAFASADASGTSPPVHLLVAGTGRLLEQARSRAAEKRLPVTFAGFLNQTEITRAYAAADCLVLPSDYNETWGLVVNEAMACGLPAIVSDRVGCHLDLVREGETGFVFPFGDTAALAEKMLLAAASGSDARAMGAAARRRVAEFSVKNAARGTLAAAEAAVRRRG